MLRTLAVLLAMSVCASAMARGPRKVALNYTRGVEAGSCVDPRELAQRVEAYTGPVLVAPATAEVSLEAHVEATATGYFARVTVGTPGDPTFGERTLEHANKDCRAFAATLAFVIATTIDPDVVLEKVGAMFDVSAPEEQLLHELERSPPVPVVLRPSVELGALRVLRTRRPPTLRLGLGGGFALSNEPAIAGVGLTSSLRLFVKQRWSIALAPRVTTGVAALDGNEARARSTSFNTNLLLCARLPASARISLALCAGPELSAFRARGLDLASSRTGWALAGGGTLRPELALQLDSKRALVFAPFVSWIAPERTLSASVPPNARVEVARVRSLSIGVLVELMRIF